MMAALLIYVSFAAILLVYCTLIGDCPPVKVLSDPASPRLEYIQISTGVLEGWTAVDPNLLIVELHADKTTHARTEQSSGRLSVSVREFGEMLKWLPPESKLAFAGEYDVSELVIHMEPALLKWGVRTVYLTDLANTDNSRL